MKKLFLLTAVVWLMVCLSGCGGGIEETPESVASDNVKNLELWIADLEKMVSADDAVKAINSYTDRMQALFPRFKALKKKYPDVNIITVGQYPESCKEHEARMKELLPKLDPLLEKVQKYTMDPRVMKALERYKKANDSMAKAMRE
jgi:hypothetical protein